MPLSSSHSKRIPIGLGKRKAQSGMGDTALVDVEIKNLHTANTCEVGRHSVLKSVSQVRAYSCHRMLPKSKNGSKAHFIAPNLWSIMQSASSSSPLWFRSFSGLYALTHYSSVRTNLFRLCINFHMCYSLLAKACICRQFKKMRRCQTTSVCWERLGARRS